MNKSVLSPMILIALLLAPTVPSEPSPQNLHRMVPSCEDSMALEMGNDLNVTSSTIPIVNPSFGSLTSRFS